MGLLLVLIALSMPLTAAALLFFGCGYVYVWRTLERYDSLSLHCPDVKWLETAGRELTREVDVLSKCLAPTSSLKIWTSQDTKPG